MPPTRDLLRPRGDVPLDRYLEPHHGFAVQRFPDRWVITWWRLGRTIRAEGSTYAAAVADLLTQIL